MVFIKNLITLLCITLLLAFSAQAATLDDAKLAIRTQDYARAVTILKPLARKGDKQAQYQLAVLYKNGLGIKKNPKNSAYWMDKSARQGYKRAQYSLGTLYEEGVGVKKDRESAIYWYSAAAKQGHKNAQKH
jgi:TPR repeat protein